MDREKPLVLATRNQNKIEEIKYILGPNFAYQTLNDYVSIQIPEQGETLLENSLTKAKFAYQISNLPAIADDSGLFIDALDGEPGVFSARYGKSDAQRIAHVLTRLQEKDDRSASFKAVFVLFLGVDNYQVFEGTCAGRIAHKPHGTHGFGYDPIFIPQGYNRTFSELGPEIKNTISHRARALKKLKAYLNI
jgi:XTP/dITP diphosphohydrolase